MPILTVIAGPNGAGKSTLTAALNLEVRLNVVDPDSIARRLNPSYPLLAAAAAGREAMVRCRRSLAHAPEALRLASEGVIFDNSGTTRQRMLEVRNGRIAW